MTGRSGMRSLQSDFGVTAKVHDDGVYGSSEHHASTVILLCLMIPLHRCCVGRNTGYIAQHDKVWHSEFGFNFDDFSTF